MQADPANDRPAPEQSNPEQSNQAPPVDTPGSESTDQAASEIAQNIESFSDQIIYLIENPSWSNAADVFLPMLITLGKGVVLAVVLFLIIGTISRWVQNLTRKALDTTELDTTLKTFLSRLAKYAVWLIALPVSLAVLGIEATSLAAVVGAAGIAIGLGLQGSLANIAAGIILLVLRPIRIGDLVDVQGAAGEITDIGMFFTTINAFNNEIVHIPNKEIISDKMRNLTGNDTRRVEIPVAVAYGTDLKHATDVIVNALNSLDAKHKDKDSAAYLTEFDDSGIEFEAHLYCDARSYLSARHDAIIAIHQALADADIRIPFPHRTLLGTITTKQESTEDTSTSEDAKASNSSKSSNQSKDSPGTEAETDSDDD